MQFLRLFHALASFLHPTRRLGSAAEEIAQCCRKAAGKRVRITLGGMTTPEARGYIRARAGDLILAQVRQVAHRSGLGEQERTELTLQATDALVGMVLRDWLAARPAKPIRRAA